MISSDFQIAFSYNSFLYIGLVRTLENELSGYAVVLENEKKEFYVELFLKPSSSGDWEFQSSGGRDAAEYYDKEFLREIALLIQAQLN